FDIETKPTVLTQKPASSQKGPGGNRKVKYRPTLRSAVKKTRNKTHPGGWLILFFRQKKRPIKNCVDILDGPLFLSKEQYQPATRVRLVACLLNSVSQCRALFYLPITARYLC
ncbi:hypothetical protein, partial [Lactiplantibacillus plantarum]|uniref:hypothetical protein n=1 Tax=Lactiplantibacillus plantarum TaxID=1590 RepID=UPI002380E23B